jgi:hypothetical protein
MKLHKKYKDLIKLLMGQINFIKNLINKKLSLKTWKPFIDHVFESLM